MEPELEGIGYLWRPVTKYLACSGIVSHKKSCSNGQRNWTMSAPLWTNLRHQTLFQCKVVFSMAERDISLATPGYLDLSVKLGLCLSGLVSSQTCYTGNDLAAKPGNISLLMWAIHLGSIWIPLSWAQLVPSSGLPERTPEQNMPLVHTPAPEDRAVPFRHTAFQPVSLNLGLTGKQEFTSGQIPLLHSIHFTASLLTSSVTIYHSHTQDMHKFLLKRISGCGITGVVSLSNKNR